MLPKRQKLNHELLDLKSEVHGNKDGILTGSTTELLQVLHERKENIFDNPHELNIRRKIIQQKNKLIKSWVEANENLVDTLKLAKQIGIREAKKINEKDLNIIKINSNPEIAYIHACKKYYNVFLTLIKRYFDNGRTSSDEDRNISIDLLNKTLMKDCVRHLCFSEALDKDGIDVILLDPELTEHMLNIHPNIVALNEKYSEYSNSLLLSIICPLCIHGPLSKTSIIIMNNGEPEICNDDSVNSRIEFARILIRKLPLKTIRNDFNLLRRSSISEFEKYAESINALLFIAYEKEKNEKLVPYEEADLKAIQACVKQVIERTDDLEALKLAYENYANVSSIKPVFDQLIQEKACQILTERAQYDDLEECYHACQRALDHPMFSSKSTIRENVEKLLHTLNQLQEIEKSPSPKP